MNSHTHTPQDWGQISLLAVIAVDGVLADLVTNHVSGCKYMYINI